MKNLLAINSEGEWPFTPKEDWEMVEAARQITTEFVSHRHRFRVMEMLQEIDIGDQVEEREWLKNRWGVWLCTQTEY